MVKVKDIFRTKNTASRKNMGLSSVGPNALYIVILRTLLYYSRYKNRANSADLKSFKND